MDPFNPNLCPQNVLFSKFAEQKICDEKGCLKPIEKKTDKTAQSSIRLEGESICHLVSIEYLKNIFIELFGDENSEEIDFSFHGEPLKIEQSAKKTGGIAQSFVKAKTL